MPDSRTSAGRVLPGLLLFLDFSAAYLYTFPQPNVFYAVVVLLHAVAGTVAAILLVLHVSRLLRGASVASRVGWLLLFSGAVMGIVLIKTGTSRAEWNLLYTHILLSLAGVGILLAEWVGAR